MAWYWWLLIMVLVAVVAILAWRIHGGKVERGIEQGGKKLKDTAADLAKQGADKITDAVQDAARKVQ